MVLLSGNIFKLIIIKDFLKLQITTSKIFLIPFLSIFLFTTKIDEWYFKICANITKTKMWNKSWEWLRLKEVYIRFKNFYIQN